MLLQLVVSYAEISKIRKYSDTLTETTYRELETFENLYSHGDKVIEYIKSRLLENYTLLQNWLFLFHVDEPDEDDLILTTSSLSEIYIDILQKYMKVSASHFRKDYLMFIKKRERQGTSEKSNGKN